MACLPGCFGPSQRLALQLRDAQGQLQITWNEAARPVRNAQSAALEITDGNANTWLELDLDQLRRGNVTYVRRSNMVAVRLEDSAAQRRARGGSGAIPGAARTAPALASRYGHAAA